MRLKVLIIEDDPIQSDVMAQLLGQRGYYVDVVDNGRNALRRISTGIFHVALIDYRLPEIDGLSIARVVRQLPGLSGTPRLIALTAAPQALVATAAEFDEILGKPVRPDLLIQAIERGRPAESPAPRPQPQRATEQLTMGASPPLPGAPAGKRGRILVADDDATLRGFLQLTLQSRGFEVDVAEDGLEAVKQIGVSAYDLVVIDFRMPNLDGLAAAKIIYDLTERRRRPRIVALTSTPDSLIAQDSRWHLVLDQIVSKASGVQAILLAVENCITYRIIRSERPLERIDPRALTTIMQGAG